MNINERNRHRLYDRVREVLGHDEADILMEYLPPSGWSEVATKSDLAILRREIDVQFREVDARFDAVDARFAELSADLKTEIANVRSDIGIHIRALFFSMLAANIAIFTVSGLLRR